MEKFFAKMKAAFLQDITEIVTFFGSVALIWFTMTSMAFAVFVIPSESMQPTLEVGDRVFVSKAAYGYSRHSLPLGLGDALPSSWNARLGWSSPERGDVVVLRSEDQGINLIKRVTGIAGDVIETRNGRLIVNGELVARELIDQRVYRQHVGPVTEVRHYSESLPGHAPHPIYEQSDVSFLDDFGPITVPAGHIFVMGDNRDASRDSRAVGGPGFVSYDLVIGKAMFVPFTFESCNEENGFYCPTGRVFRGL